jgi:HlyD family secretion protein
VARADLAVAEADVAVIRAQGMDAAAALQQERPAGPSPADRAL